MSDIEEQGDALALAWLQRVNDGDEPAGPAPLQGLADHAINEDGFDESPALALLDEIKDLRAERDALRAQLRATEAALAVKAPAPRKRVAEVADFAYSMAGRNRAARTLVQRLRAAGCDAAYADGPSACIRRYARIEAPKRSRVGWHGSAPFDDESDDPVALLRALVTQEAAMRAGWHAHRVCDLTADSAAGCLNFHLDKQGLTVCPIGERHKDAAIDASEASALLAALDRMSAAADGTVPT